MNQNSGIGGKLMEKAGNGYNKWKLLTMAEHCWTWLEMFGYGGKFKEMAGSLQKWLKMVEIAWKLLAMPINGLN